MDPHAPIRRSALATATRAGLAMAVLQGALVAVAPPARAQNGTVYLSPWRLEQSPLTDFTVIIIADGVVPPLSCFALTVDYDHAVLSLVSAAEGELFGNSGISTFFSRETDAQGRDVFTDCLLGFGTSVQPPGALAILTFRGLVPGTSAIQIVDAVLRDTDRAVLPGVAVAGTTVSIGTVGTAPALASVRPRLLAQPNPAGGAVRLTLEGEAYARAPAGSAGLGAAVVGIRDGVVIIHDIAGRRLRTLAMPDGTAVWDGCDDTGRPAASGVYFAIATAPGGGRAVAKIVRLE